MAAITEINQILKKAVSDGSFGLSIAYENSSFDPKQETAYIALFNLRAPTVQSDLGLNGCDLQSGVFQLDVNYKQGGGTDVILEKADEVNATFFNGQAFAGTNENVNITNVTATPVSIARGWATVSMTINYHVFTQRVQ